MLTIKSEMPLFNSSKKKEKATDKPLTGLYRYDIKKDHVLGT